eukprot:8692644-Pyramimonas_sp.AAC.1
MSFLTAWIPATVQYFTVDLHLLVVRTGVLEVIIHDLLGAFDVPGLLGERHAADDRGVDESDAGLGVSPRQPGGAVLGDRRW